MGTGKRRRQKMKKPKKPEPPKSRNVKESESIPITSKETAKKIMDKEVNNLKMGKQYNYKMNFITHPGKQALAIFILLILFIIGISMAIGYYGPKAFIKEGQEQCEPSHIKNKEAIIDWIYNQSQCHKVNNFFGMPRRQIENLIPIIDEGPDSLLVIAVISFESGWNPAFTSHAGAIGLGGIWDQNKPMLKEAGIIKEDVRELYLPDVNIRATQHMITHMRERGKGNIDRCFRFYRGLKINKKTGKPDPKDLAELKKYTTRILKAYWELKYINHLPIKEVPNERE